MPLCLETEEAKNKFWEWTGNGWQQVLDPLFYDFMGDTQTLFLLLLLLLKWSVIEYVKLLNTRKIFADIIVYIFVH